MDFNEVAGKEQADAQPAKKGRGRKQRLYIEIRACWFSKNVYKSVRNSYFHRN